MLLRPSGFVVKEGKGRIVVGYGHLGFEVLLASVYGVSGGLLSNQLRWLKEIAQAAAASGIPFIFGGDWQVSPTQLASSGFPRVIDARIIAPASPTTAVSRHPLDYFVVSSSIAELQWNIGISQVANFRPHFVVCLDLKVPRHASPASRLALPRSLEVSIPIGPQRPGIVVDWEAWHEVTKLTHHSGQASGAGGAEVGHLLKVWYAGAEAELLSRFGHCRTVQEQAYLGIGNLPKIVTTSSRGKFRDSPEWVGILGHRLSWAARALQLMCTCGGIIRAFGFQVESKLDLSHAFCLSLKSEFLFQHGLGVRRQRNHFVHRHLLTQRPWQWDALRRLGFRAAAILKEEIVA